MDRSFNCASKALGAYLCSDSYESRPFYLSRLARASIKTSCSILTGR